MVNAAKKCPHIKQSFLSELMLNPSLKECQKNSKKRIDTIVFLTTDIHHLNKPEAQPKQRHHEMQYVEKTGLASFCHRRSKPRFKTSLIRTGRNGFLLEFLPNILSEAF